MAIRETQEQAQVRLQELQVLQEHYSDFLRFLRDVMALLGFSTTGVQEDIAKFLVYGPQYLMIMAQRGQAKTTITAAYAVWCLIHDPTTRILIVSAAGSQASDISTLIVRIVMTMDELQCLRPDKTMGDRTSVEHFDVHYSLKGIDKSASVACAGISATLQGKRADVLIADDIESSKNSLTALMREQLLALTRDFTSICSTGRIIYLGTPQSSESVYNTLPSRGFTIRIWPGRFPTPAQMLHYGEHLAPSIRRACENSPILQRGGGLDGTVGRPVDPIVMPEQALQKKELDQGAAYFSLQHMLSTKLLDADRYTLKTENMVCMAMAYEDMLPLEVHRNMGKQVTHMVDAKTYTFSTAHPNEAGVAKRQFRLMYLDPAGGGAGKNNQGGDETGYVILDFLNGNVFLQHCSSVKGGYDGKQLEELADIAFEFKPDKILIEKNFGFGAFSAVWLPVLRSKWEAASVEDDMVFGQKELRIIDTLEPVLGRGALIVNESVIKNEYKSIAHHPAARAHTFSLFHQLTKITKDRDSLIHDDRLDALAGAVKYYSNMLAIDQTKKLESQKKAEFQKWLKDPMGRDRIAKTAPSNRASLLSKYKRG